jgi:uncharacterized protein
MQYEKKDLRIKCRENYLAITRFAGLGDAANKNRIVSLHGAGSAVRQRTFYLGERIAKLGGDFICFDFSGHGESTGTLAASSLQLRRDEALCVIEQLFGGVPDVIIGNSMGGYVAMELLQYIQPKKIVLLCPAIYSSAAFDVQFDEKFTNILRTPGSFLNNRVEKYLESYEGEVFLAIGTEDNVIPREVIDIIMRSLRNASRVQFENVSGAPHVLHVWASEGHSNGEAFVKKIEDFIFDT